jgi:transmembrane sensor
MEAENNIDELLVSYLFNESAGEEKLFARDWINSSEENRQYFEGLKKTFGLLAMHGGTDKINVDEEWKHLQELIAAHALQSVQFNENTALRENPAEPAEDEITETGNTRWKKVYRLIIPAAVAASLIFALATGWGLFNNRKNDQQTVAPDTESVAKINPANTVVQHENNTSGKTKKFALPDGSRVTLSNNSELTYSEPAADHKRNVLLKGEADFAVAKDKTKPFTIFSGEISTMAVGTRFTVTAFEKEKFIQVKLDEGKVMVKSEKKVNNKLTDSFYLLPGQKLIYDKNQQTAKIRSFGRDDKNLADNAGNGDKTANDNPLLPLGNKKSWFMFNNQSLIEIFHSLELMYDVKIVYAKKDIDQRYFIGTFSKSDSVENILQQIAMLNKLTVTKKDNSFIINKRK